MSIRTMSELVRAMQGRAGPPMTRLAGLTGLAALAVLGGSVVSEPADATPRLCGDRTEILERLAQSHAETPQSLGLSGDGGVIEVLVSPEGGWTMLVTYPRRPTCVVAAGEAWQVLQIVGEPA